ncbi:MAG: hypothetical protein ACRDGM_12820 [bacterium]
MDWKKILKEAYDGDPVHVERAAFDEDSLERRPEDVTLLVPDSGSRVLDRPRARRGLRSGHGELSRQGCATPRH